MVGAIVTSRLKDPSLGKVRYFAERHFLAADAGYHLNVAYNRIDREAFERTYRTVVESVRLER